ncbi:MAG: tetratricopeptide repeat protein [Nibricoccus sp.]
MRQPFRPFAVIRLFLLLLPAALLAQDIVLPAPFAGRNTEAPAGDFALQIAAERALQMGFPSAAVDLYQKLIDNPALKPDDRNKLLVAQATALLEDNRTDEAAAALKKYVGLPTAACQLRLALIAFRERRFDDARRQVGGITPDQLPEDDRSWWYYLNGKLAETVRDFTHANIFLQQAVDVSKSEPQRVHFSLAQELARLSMGEFSEARATELRQGVERFQGRPLYAAVTSYVIVLNQLGRKAEAIAVLQRQLQALPLDERAVSDEWRLILGLLSGAEEGVGRNAIGALIATGVDRGKQRVALQFLARASGSVAARDDFRRRLDELIGAPAPHPLLEDLLIFRAQVALAEKNYGRAEGDATRVLEQYPGSQYRGHALGVLTGVNWEQLRYRSAASQAAKAREALQPGESRAQLGVLLAEAWFRAGMASHAAADYRTAADAYAATLNEVPSSVEPGVLMFQRLVAEVEVANAEEGKADRFARAQMLLDQMGADPRFDAVNRWKAEWNLSRSLEAAGEIAKAYERVNKLLGANGDTSKLPADLRAQLRWLQASLSFKAGEPARTLTLANQLLDALDGVETGLRSQIASMTLLLQAQANFTLTPPRPDDASERLRKLRAEYPRADATIYSYLVEAEEKAHKGQLVEAQATLQTLADNPEYANSSYVPYALYQAALYAERRAQEKFLTEAFNILDRLVKKYPSSELQFYARMKQGNLLRQTSDYPGAQNHFALLVNDFPQHQDVSAARLALADCHAAQAASDISHQERAATIYESLVVSLSTPTDIRAEAGYKYGLNLARRGNGDRAREEWVRLITSILPDDSKAEALGAKGRFWVSKTLFDLGDLLERQHKPEEAQVAYDKIITKALPQAALAKERLANLRSQKNP